MQGTDRNYLKQRYYIFKEGDTLNFVKILKRYDLAIWIRVFGSAFTNITNYMIRPFLILYLFDKLEQSLLLSTLILGMEQVIAAVFGLIAGQWSDRYGRKPILVFSLLVQTVSMAGFIWAQSVWEFGFFTILNGIGAALFRPAASAQVVDIVPENQRAEVFALLHMSLNVGAAVGPLLGVILFNIDPSYAFASGALVLFLFLLAMYWKVPETKPNNSKKRGYQQANVGYKFRLRDHKLLVYLTLISLPMTLLYAQVTTNLPIHLKESIDNYQYVFATMLSVNGVLVILLQLIIAKKTEKTLSSKVLTVGFLLFALVALGYGYSQYFWLLIITEIIFSVAEMLTLPHLNKLISFISPEQHRGRYFAIHGLQWAASKAAGPSLFGLVLVNFGGNITFYILSLLCLISMLLFWHFIRVEKRGIDITVGVITAEGKRGN